MTRRAKIVCTLGPASSSPERVSCLVRAGLDVARLNMSHGSYAEHLAAYLAVRSAGDEIGRSVGVLVDLQGPKIRLGRFASGSAMLSAGNDFDITGDDVEGTAREASSTYPELAADVRAGDRILVDDGRLVLEVTRVRGSRIRTRVLIGGQVSDHKGLNVPGAGLGLPALTPKDEEDLRWALGLRADFIALSFVRGPQDADRVRAIMDEAGVQLPVIAKIEKPQAVSALPEIPVIVATQMLESMISAPRPTRAEASDVANAVLDGADAVMLSAETSIGAYPAESVATMAKIIVAAERECLSAAASLARVPTTTGGAIARAAAEVGAIVGASALVAFTMSGETARRLARYRSAIPLLAFTPLQATRSQLALTWGVETFIVPPVSHTDDMVRQVETALLDIGRCEKGDKVVIVAGSPPGTPGRTNALRVHRIGDAISSRGALTTG